MELEQQKKPVVIKTPEELAPYAFSLYQRNVPKETAKEMLLKATLDFDTYSIDIPAVIDIILQSIYSGESYKGETKLIPVFLSEKQFIEQQAETISAIIPIKTKIIFNFLLSCLVNSRYNDHETGWVVYNKKRIFAEAGITKMSNKEKATLLQALVSAGLLKMRVIGKKNPKLCYRLEWRHQILPDDNATLDNSILLKMTPQYNENSLNNLFNQNQGES